MHSQEFGAKIRYFILERSRMLTDLTFIHAADLHLDSPFYGISHLPEPIFARIKESTFASVRHIIDAAVRENVDFILLAGTCLTKPIEA